MKNKKVLFFLINMNLGGTEKSFLNLINTLPKEIEVDLLLLEKSGQLLMQLPPRVTLRIIDEHEEVNFLIENNLLLYAVHCFKRFKFFQMIRAIYFYGKSKFSKCSDFKFEAIKNKIPIHPQEYDIAIAYAGPHNFISTYIAKNVVSKKKIQWIHFDVSKINFNRLISQNIYRHFDEIKAVSKEVLNQFITQLPNCESKTEVLYNLLNVEQVNYLSTKSDIGFQDKFSGIRILSVGRLSKEKGHSLVIPVIRRLIDEGFNVRYYVIGEGDQEDELKTQTNKFTLQHDVIFLGAKMNPYPFMKQSDIYLQPSFYEGHCITILEAKVLNKVIVCTNFSGAAEELKDGKTGLIVGIDSDAIFTGLQIMIENSDLRKTFENNLIEEGRNSRIIQSDFL